MQTSWSYLKTDPEVTATLTKITNWTGIPVTYSVDFLLGVNKVKAVDKSPVNKETLEKWWEKFVKPLPGKKKPTYFVEDTNPVGWRDEVVSEGEITNTWLSFRLIISRYVSIKSARSVIIPIPQYIASNTKLDMTG